MRADADASVLRDAIESMIIDVFQSFFELPVRSGALLAALPEHEAGYAGVVPVYGHWDGLVIVKMSASLARSCTMAILRMPGLRVGHEDFTTTVGELANVVAGNLKVLLPGPSHIGLPVVIDGTDFRFSLPRAGAAMHTTFECLGHAMDVSLVGDLSEVRPPFDHLPS